MSPSPAPPTTASAPRPLAQRLFELENGSHTLDTFHRSAATYADVLGPDGLDRYRELAQRAWEAADQTGPRWGDTFQIRQARIGVAIGARAPDELIDVTCDDLAIPDDDLDIVQLLSEVGRTDEAIDHVRDRVGKPFGDGRFAYPPDTLVEILHRDGRDDEAWAAMLEHGCGSDLAMRLAKRCESRRPLESTARRPISRLSAA